MQITIPLIRGHCGFAIARLFIENIIVMKEIASLIRFFFIKLGVIVDLPTKKHHKGRIEERRKSTKDDGPRMRLVILYLLRKLANSEQFTSGYHPVSGSYTIHINAITAVGVKDILQIFYLASLWVEFSVRPQVGQCLLIHS